MLLTVSLFKILNVLKSGEAVVVVVVLDVVHGAQELVTVATGLPFVTETLT